MKTVLTLLALACAGLLWLRHENTTLSRSFGRANQVAQAQKTQIATLEAQLVSVAALSARHERAQVTLREKLESAGSLAARRETTITRLINENEALRRWYRAALPDDVRQLHQRTALASAGDYRQRLSEGEPLPDAGQRSGD